MMKITYLGQAGLLFDNGKIKIMTDPYLSNSVVRVNPRNYRRLPVDESFLKIVPDVLVLTHNHLDHTDPDTLVHYICGEKSVTVLAPEAAFEEARKNTKGPTLIEFIIDPEELVYPMVRPDGTLEELIMDC